MDRRQFVWKVALATAGVMALPGGRTVSASGRRAGAVPTGAGTGPYGALAATADDNGLFLPAGFTSRIVAVAGEPVGDTGFTWPPRPDGAAVQALADGGWRLVVNSNLISVLPPGPGSTSMIEFAPDGTVRAASSVLSSLEGAVGTVVTPWGTVLVAEQDLLGERGAVWEVDLDSGASAQRAALGLFSHHAIAVDPGDSKVYLTETHPDGVLYRFSPTETRDLSAGTLEACQIDDGGVVAWLPVPDPSAASARLRDQVPNARRFPGGGGVVVIDGMLVFASHDNHEIHSIDLAAERYRLVWRGQPDELGVDGATLSGPDAMCVWAPSGDIVVAEDGGNLELVLITADGQLAPLVRVSDGGPAVRRLTGPAFDPSGTRLYFSVQRATTPRSVGEIVPGQDAADFGGGITYEVVGPFREAGAVVVPSTTVPVTDAPTTVPASTVPATVTPSVAPTAPPTAPAATTLPERVRQGGSIVGLVTGAVLAGVIVVGYTLVRRLRNAPPEEQPEVEPEPPAPPPAPPPPVVVITTPQTGSAELERQLEAEQPTLVADEPAVEFRPILGTTGVETTPTTEGRVLYSRDSATSSTGFSRVLSAEDDEEKLATPVQWRTSDGAEGERDDDDDDAAGSDDDDAGSDDAGSDGTR